MLEKIILDISLIFILATLGGYTARILKQPVIPFYILAGIILGPLSHLIVNTDLVITFAEIGIAFLLFFVGLEICLDKLKSISKISSYSGIFLTLLLGLAGYLFVFRLGFSNLESVYIGLVVAFSSTAVVVKILSDKKELDTLHGRLTLGVLIVQDFLAILALSALSSLYYFSPLILIDSILLSLVIILCAILASTYLFPPIFKIAARSTELLFLITISVFFIFSLVFGIFGLSMVLGAFIAGVSLANLPYTTEMIARVKSLKDFFSTFFFVALGLNLSFGLGKFWTILLILIIFVIFIKPLLTLVLFGALGYKKRTSFLTAISLAQISEFSLIIVFTGFRLGHLTEDFLTLTTLIAIISIIFSTYLINFSNYLIQKFAPFLKFFEKETTQEELFHLPPSENLKNHTILFGCDRVGGNVLKTLIKLKNKILVVDYNPEIIKKLRNENIHCIYGDMADVEILDKINLPKAKMIISTVPDLNNNLLILEKAKNRRILTYVTAQNVDDALELYHQGADYVILPHLLGGERVSLLLEEVKGNLSKILSMKKSHVAQLQKHLF